MANINDDKNKDSKSYWQDVENKSLSSDLLKSEFGQTESSFDIGSVKKDRRDFLKVLGFSVAAVPIASCKHIPVKKALPYLHKSDQVTPGVANWYATSMDPLKGASLLVKTREGRPIKIEGNPMSPITKGGTFATDQASVLSLYDSFRYKKPQINGTDTNWNKIDQEVLEKLNEVDLQTKEIVLLTGAISSPSTKKIISKLKTKYKVFKHIIYDPAMLSSILEANNDSFGISNFPKYNFEKAKYIVGFSADFLGTWLSPVEHTKGYTEGRDLLTHHTISKHIHFESFLSLTGSNADERYTVSPKEEEDFIVNLLASLQKKLTQTYLPSGQKLPQSNLALVEKIANELIKHKKESLVVSGSNNKDIQVMINSINHLLSNYNNTLVLYKNTEFIGPNDQEMESLITRMSSGNIGAIITVRVNPVYSYFNSEKFKNAFKNVPVRISLDSVPNETSKLCLYIMPSNHYLESWNDYYQAPNIYSLAQPVIRPLFDTRMEQSSLLKILGESTDYYKYIKNTAIEKYFKKQNKYLTKVDFFNHAIHDGIVLLTDNDQKLSNFKKLSILKSYDRFSRLPVSYGKTLQIYKKIGIQDGELINNPWLQELPDPITKATWDNYFLISPIFAKKNNLKLGDVIEVSGNGHTLSLPIVVQPGVHQDVFAVAMGYGRVETGKAGKNVGQNAYPFSIFKNGTYQLSMSNIKVKKTGKNHKLALTQTHHSMEGRDIVKEVTLKEWNSKFKHQQKKEVKFISMWGDDHDKKGVQWAMAIDLNKCTGCSGCVVSCNAENNVPVVGKDEVHKRREMHWLRIDRYYTGDENNPEVVHQPVMCQHCDNAPCENVCPVLATVQSSDGLNQQVYNRCIGTRYCANNCPYKVRRFNWFDYPHNDKVANMVLNPDVTVRSRGVMEKCSMCIQRIQEGKLEAKKEGRDVQDDDIKLACQQSCPGGAIVFGNLNNPKSDIVKLLKNSRNYDLLDELNVQPRVSYLTQVRNKE